MRVLLTDAQDVQSITVAGRETKRDVWCNGL